MTSPSVLRLVHRIARICSFPLLGAALLLGISASDVRADFVGFYAPANFTLTNHGGGSTTVNGVEIPTANGSYLFPNLLTLVLTGTNDGSGLDGYTDLTAVAAANGILQFHYQFNVADDPVAQYAGYLLGSSFFLLADMDGIASGQLTADGSVSVPVTAGELIGFRAGGDDQGGVPAVLTISDFAAPVPEPGSLQLLLTAIAAVGAAGFYKRASRSRR